MKDLLKKHREYYGKDGSLFVKKKGLYKNILSTIYKSYLLPTHVNNLGFKVTKNSILNFFEYSIGSSKLFSMPRQLILEVSNKCNQTCIQCIRATEKYDSSNEGIMSFDDFVKIYSQFPNIEKVDLIGLGEPSLNKDLFKMINYIKKSKKKPPIISITSNGFILTGKAFKQLLDSEKKPDEFTISLDATNPKTYYSLKATNLDFETILSNIKRLTSDKDFSDTEIYISMVVMEQNYKEMPDFIRLAKELNVSGAMFFDVYPTWVYKKNEHIISQNVDELKKVYSETKQIADELNVSMTYQYVNSKVWGEEKCYNPCRSPWAYIYVTYDGFVTPCCFRPYAKQFNFGNILKMNVRDVWNSEKYKDFRRIIKSKRLPTICEPCFSKH